MAETQPPTTLIVDAVSVERDPTDKLLTRLMLATADGVASVALTREAVQQLWNLIDQSMAHWDCDCPYCTAERMAEESAAAAGSLH